MDSKEINEAILELDGRDDLVYEWYDTGKAIPYIGWYWRTVNFDSDEAPEIGIIPPGPGTFMGDVAIEAPHGQLVGFMENNKWDYDYAEMSNKQWAEMKALIINALTVKTREAFEAIDNAMQALVKN